MKKNHKKLTSTLLALLIAGTIATPAAARSQAYHDLDCSRWYCHVLQHWLCGNTKPNLPGTGGTDTPEVDTPDTEEPNTPDTEVPNIPDTDTPDTPDTETPDTPEEDIPSQDDTASSVSALERQVVALVNQERAAYGLPALSLSGELSDGARLKSQDMRDNRYFDHNSPTYGTPFEMMRSLGITYAAAAENIAMGYSTAEAVVNGWMNSAGHRANILSTNYTHIGVGHVDGYWTQWFTR